MAAAALWSRRQLSTSSAAALTSPLPPMLSVPQPPPSPSPSPLPSYSLWELPSRFSHSSLWSLQSAFYDSLGEFAFSSAVTPHFVTSNSLIAQHLALCVHAWLTEGQRAAAAAAGDLPPVILELGAGHGRLTFLVLTHLARLLCSSSSSSSSPSPPPLPFVYVASDGSPSCLSFLRHHPSLRPFIDCGQLDLALYDCETPQPLRLLCSGRRIDGGSAVGGAAPPLFVLCPYVLNSLRADAWQAREGGLRLFEGRVSLWRAKEEMAQGGGRCSAVDRDDPALLSTLKEEWDWEEVPDCSSYYPPHLQSVFDCLVAAIREEASAAPPTHPPPSFSFLFPSSALSCLQHLAHLSHHQLSVVVVDKAVTRLSDMAQLKAPHIARHGGISVMLNMLALHLFFTHTAASSEPQVSGHAESSEWAECGVKLSLLTLHPSATSRVGARVRVTFQLLRSLAADTVGALWRGLKEDSREGWPSLHLLLAVLRISQHDVDVFYKLRTALLHHTTTLHDSLTARVLHDLALDCRALCQHYYPLSYRTQLLTAPPRPPPHPAAPAGASLPVELAASSSSSLSSSPLFASRGDAAFELGRLCLSVGAWEQARTAFECSWRDAGHHPLTAYHISVANWEMGDRPTAQHWCNTAHGIADEHTATIITQWHQQLHTQHNHHLHHPHRLPPPSPPPRPHHHTDPHASHAVNTNGRDSERLVHGA